MGKGLESRNSNDNIVEEQVGDCREMGNHEVKERTVNNAISGNILGDLQYKLPHRNEKFSGERSQKIIEKEMIGMRKEIPKVSTYSCYGAPKGKVG